jgi:uncharacterized protein YbjQ (UPF0145 family)
MTGQKKDLTSIEELGEFFHEETDSESFETTEEFSEPVESSENAFIESTETDPPSESFEPPESEENDQSFENENPTIRFETPSLEETSPKTEIMNWDENPIKETIEPYHEPVKPIFEEIKQFGEESSLSTQPAEANPAFSLILQNVVYQEDKEEIIELLKESRLFDADLESMTKSLERGSLLIPRVSEFVAIYLAHKIRKFSLTLKVGLADRLHPTKLHDSDKGLINRKTLHQNHTHQFHFEKPTLAQDIMLSTSGHLDGFRVIRYLGVATEHCWVDQKVVEDETSPQMQKIFSDLAEKLKPHALEKGANAVVGLNYQLQALDRKYKLLCTGNLAWLESLGS